MPKEINHFTTIKHTYPDSKRISDMRIFVAHDGDVLSGTRPFSLTKLKYRTFESFPEIPEGQDVYINHGKYFLAPEDATFEFVRQSRHCGDPQLWKVNFKKES